MQGHLDYVIVRKNKKLSCSPWRKVLLTNSFLSTKVPQASRYSRDIASDSVCNQASGCTGCISAQLHYTNQTDGQLPSFVIVVPLPNCVTYRQITQACTHKQRNGTRLSTISGASSALPHLLMSSGKMSGGEIRARCFLTYACFV